MEILQAYKSANDLTIQLITLASGILALSITFMRDVVKSDSPTWALKGAWIILLLSVCCGVWALMGITGDIFAVTTGSKELKASYGLNIIIPSAFQITSFVTAIILLIIYGARTMKPKEKEKSENDVDG